MIDQNRGLVRQTYFFIALHTHIPHAFYDYLNTGHFVRYTRKYSARLAIKERGRRKSLRQQRDSLLPEHFGAILS